MMQDLTVSIFQQSLHWQDPEANRRQFSGLIDDVYQQQAIDLIVLPEMFTTGFSMSAAKLAEPVDGPTYEWLATQAANSGAVVTGSLIVEERGKFVNRLLWMRPDGSYDHYDKRHTFRMAGEHKHYTPGDDRLVVALKGWRCCPMICYDLRFPVWSRNREDYDLLLYVANWPAARAYHWQSLLKARAIENLSCVVGVNRIGEDGKGHAYSGDSVVLDAEGRALVEPGGEGGCFTVTLSAEALASYRKKFPAHRDADDFELRP